MTTLEDLRQKIRQQILGYTRDQQQISMLTQNITASDTSFTLDTSTLSVISRGLVEIDEELILVKQVDNTTGTLSVMGGVLGRGREGTTAASHSTGALVTMSPVMPRQGITNAINDTIIAMGSELRVVKTVEISKLAPVFEYALPAEAIGVHYVVGQTIGPSKIWFPMPRWRFNEDANTTDFPSGKSLQLMDDIIPGRAMRVAYYVHPGELSTGTDDWTAVTGYPDSAKDIAVWGAVARLVPSYEVARLQAQSIEGTERDNLIPAKAALQTAEYYRSLYQDALAREVKRFYDESPNFAFWQGG